MNTFLPDFRPIDAQESYERTLMMEQEIRNNYNSCSIEERDYLKEMIKVLETKRDNSECAIIYGYYFTELAAIKERYKKKYRKCIVTFNENYSGKEGETFCSNKFIDLTDDEIINPYSVIEQTISDAYRIQMWKEETHNSNFRNS